MQGVTGGHIEGRKNENGRELKKDNKGQQAREIKTELRAEIGKQKRRTTQDNRKSI